MKVKTNVKVEKTKHKIVIEELNSYEFKKGEWLKFVPASNKLELTYTSRNNTLIISDTPKIKCENVR